MSLGQTMISTAFFCLLTMAVLTANRMIIERSKSTLQLEAVEGATNVANALLSEILTKKFDSQVTVDGTGKITGPYNSANWVWPSYYADPFHPNGPWPYYPSSFDPPTAMGTSSTALDNVMVGGAPDSAVAGGTFKSVNGSSSNWFDDMDDYCGDGTRQYVRAASSGSIQGYRLTVNVYYVTKANPNTASNVQTFYKRIDVTVSNATYLSKSLVFSAIAAY